MGEPLRLMCVLAHPDDECQGTGGILAKYAAEGVETFVVTATRGERGWAGVPRQNPGLEGLGKIREAELRASIEALGVHCLDFLDYIDGDLDQADPEEAIGRITSLIRRYRPQVVVTFDPAGAYGHPDHIAICQFTTAATVCAADPTYPHADSLPPHRVSKLYYMVISDDVHARYKDLLDAIVMEIDGVPRRITSIPHWAVTARIDCAAYWPQVWQAIQAHHSQMPTLKSIVELPEEAHRDMWISQQYYRAFSLVNGGRILEDDLFAGLR